MNRILQFIIFISVFLLIYSALNFYVLYRLSALFGISRNYVFYVVVFIAAASFPLMNLVERSMSNYATRLLYALSSIWMGIILFFISSLLVYEIARLMFMIPARMAGITIISLVSLLTIYSVFNAFSVSVKEVRVPLGKDFTAAQLTDLHLGAVRQGGYLEGVVDKTNKLKPDAVFITGDLIDGSADVETDMFKLLDKLEAPVFFVSGNHETYAGLEDVYNTLGKTRVRILKDEVVDFKGIQIAGVSYSSDVTLLPKMNKTAILLHHSPTGMEQAKKAGVSLQLSGHTHNGQIWPFTLLSKLVFPYNKGLYDLDGMYLYVSPGTGTWGPYMRLGSSNEITLISLK